MLLRAAGARDLLALLLLAGVMACEPPGRMERTTVHVAAARLVATPVPAAPHRHAAGSTAEPLILGPALITAENLVAASAVAVGADGNYYVRLGGAAARDSVVAVDPETGAVTPAAPSTVVTAAPAVDLHGRVYAANAAAGSVDVLDPAEGTGVSRPLLTQLAAPAAVTVDRRRGRLLVAERGAGRLRVYELP